MPSEKAVSKRKKPVAPPVPRVVALYEENTVGPIERLSISDGMQNERTVAAWWERAKLYAEAMRGLDRVTMLCYDPDDKNWYLASIPEEVPHARV